MSTEESGLTKEVDKLVESIQKAMDVHADQIRFLASTVPGLSVEMQTLIVQSQRNFMSQVYNSGIMIGKYYERMKK